MNYHGKLYGKLWDKYFDTGRTTDEFDNMEKRILELESELARVKNENIRESGKSFCQCGFRSASIEDEYCEQCHQLLMKGK